MSSEYGADQDTDQDVPIGPARTQPALRTLQIDQRELLVGGETVRHGLRDGFPTLGDAVSWYQRAIIRTLGAIATSFDPTDLVRDRTLAASLVIGGERETLSENPPSFDAARDYRDRLERLIVLPACSVSYDRLRTRAGEYLDDDAVAPDKVDPADQDHVAMRPSFTRKDVEQATALRELIRGFDHYDELKDWLHDLLEPSNGAISPMLAAEIGRDRVARAHLIRAERPAALTQPEARRWRERFAALIVLPAFVRGIRSMDGGELVKQRSTGLDTPMG